MIWDALKRVFQGGERKERALVVEDDPAIRDLIRYHLKTAGMGMTAVRSCDEALELATRTPERFSLFIFETVVDGRNGLELARQVRLARETSRIPILFLLDRGTEDEAARLKRTFAHTRVMMKPFSGLRFIEEVKAAIRSRNTRPTAKSSLRGSSPVPRPVRMRVRGFDGF